MFRDLWRRRTTMMEEMNQMAGAASRSKQAARDRDHLISRINDIQRAFNLPLVYFDAVAARWDAELAKGKTPDLSRH